MSPAPAVRLALRILGAVQGVGFRPFVYRLARELGLSGFVKNTPAGVEIEIEGLPLKIEAFQQRLQSETPPLAFIHRIEAKAVDARGTAGFEIQSSGFGGEASAIVLPDAATCSECLRECLSPRDRRFQYPFLNCTNCGPRFSIVLALPYDRSRTTMARFPMCEACRIEYEDPADRRFHAQPTACPECGPQLALLDAKGREIARGHEALLQTARAIGTGAIAAVKGLGGFHLMADAEDGRALRELRQRKNREEKPFAVMVRDLEMLCGLALISERERDLLASPQAPIVLVRRRKAATVSSEVAPGNPNLGLFLPYTPLHHLLLRELGRPLVATSGNLSDEPICTEEREVVGRLEGIADLFLVHDRPIARPVDDSVIRVIGEVPVFLRRARGYAPFPVFVKRELPSLLATGGHQKVTVAVGCGRNVFLSQHIGDLGSPEAEQAFVRTAEDLPALYGVVPLNVVTDEHPEYATTRWGKSLATPRIAVQHHEAHIHSVLAETGFEGLALGLAWDGTGYGSDGTIWGGEFFRVSGGEAVRVGRFRTFPLPGGERAVREPRRTAAGLLFEAFGRDVEAHGFNRSMVFTTREGELLAQMLERKISSPRTSSAGRLFDAVASLLEICHAGTFEGQAAMELEFAAEASRESFPLEFEIENASEPGLEFEVNWFSLLTGLAKGRRLGFTAASLARGFHQALAVLAGQLAGRLEVGTVIVSGGCFQNRLLTELVIHDLDARGISLLRNRLVPPNDGGLSLGQVHAAAHAWAAGVHGEGKR